MRNETFLIAGAVAALMATACDKVSSITGPEVPYAKRADALTSHTSTQDLPWDGPPVVPDPCNSDVVTITDGSTHFVFGSTSNINGIHLSISASSRGTGTGVEPDFLVYKVSDQTNDSFQDPVGLQSTLLDEERFLILAPQSVDNYIMHMVFKLTVNPNGDPTASFDHSFTECVG